MKDLISKLDDQKFIVVTEEQLKELLDSSHTVFEKDTRLRDFIRVLKYEDNVYLQERTNLGEIMIRKFSTEEEAMKLVKDRLEIYDKMWDGCGCKINYYE